MNLLKGDSLITCSQLPTDRSSVATYSSLHPANANNNCNAHNGIGATSITGSPRPTLAKTIFILNGTGREGEVELMETEEEEEEERKLPMALSSSVHSYKKQGQYIDTARRKECSPQHVQELQSASQYPMSGDLPSLDPGLPSPSLGFDLPEHGGASSPSTSPNSPSSASYGSNRPPPIPSHYINSPPSPTPAATSPTSPQAHTAPAAHPPTYIHTTIAPTTPPPPFLLPFTSQMSSNTGSSSTGGGDQQEHTSVEEGEGKELEGVGPYVCQWNDCNMEFPNLSYLVAHLDRGHTATMVTYRCLWKDCQRGMKPFDARYKLITHLRCHTGEKPYKCDMKGCCRSFSRLENLKLHVRTHTGEKPYACHYENCNKRFNNTSDRAKHMKTHITRKPYACKIPGCNKSYTDPSSMRKHVKFAHRMREGSSESSSSSSTGSSKSWSRSSPRKGASPLHLLSSGQASPGVLLRYPIPPANKVPVTAHSPPNRMSVIQKDISTGSSTSQPSVVSSYPTPAAHYLKAEPTVISASPPPLLPLSVLQVPGTGPGFPSIISTTTGYHPVMMQVEGTDQKVIVFVPSSSVPPTAEAVVEENEGEIGGSVDACVGQKQTTVLPPSQVAATATDRPSVLVTPSPKWTRRAASTTVDETISSQSSESETVEHEVRMQVAQLQQQLQSTYQQEASSMTAQSSPYPIQLTSTVAVTRTTVPSPLKAALAVPNIKAEAIPIGILPTQQPVQQPPLFLPAAGRSLMLQPQLVQSSSRVGQYVQPTSFLQVPQLPNLTSVNIAQTLVQPGLSTSQPGSPVAIRPLTVVTPTHCLGISGQTVVLSTGQMVSVMPSTPHVLLPQGTISNTSQS